MRHWLGDPGAIHNGLETQGPSSPSVDQAGTWPSELSFRVTWDKMYPNSAI